MRIEMVIKAKDLRQGDQLKGADGWRRVQSVDRNLWRTGTVDLAVEGCGAGVVLSQKTRVIVLRDA